MSISAADFDTFLERVDGIDRSLARAGVAPGPSGDGAGESSLRVVRTGDPG
jgi:hypothetical protein